MAVPARSSLESLVMPVPSSCTVPDTVATSSCTLLIVAYPDGLVLYEAMSGAPVALLPAVSEALTVAVS